MAEKFTSGQRVRVATGYAVAGQVLTFLYTSMYSSEVAICDSDSGAVLVYTRDLLPADNVTPEEAARYERVERVLDVANEVLWPQHRHYPFFAALLLDLMERGEL